ncbi:MAG: methylmalonyl Co-A mutase-associated GTPase MeaB [Deltaproteobacteria bacterium]|nr:methylmalonyl Co-A mutase-associated GTPase MeaB [Deltaproteobacteria bacterium]
MGGDPRAVARAITLVENGPDGPALLRELPDAAPVAIGLTGAPGSGKSTLTGRLIDALRKRGRRVGVLAVDPSSPFTGGAVLGDRIRMGTHGNDPHVFIRSMATRGHYGGLSVATADAARVMAAAGFERILVETVGVGQSEVEVMHLARCVVLVLMPGAGDGVQSMKSGIMEIADVFALNKSYLPGVDRLEQDVREHAQYMAARRRQVLVRTNALLGHGVEELCDRVEEKLEEDT